MGSCGRLILCVWWNVLDGSDQSQTFDTAATSWISS